MSADVWSWAEDGGAIIADVDGVERRIANVSTSLWIEDREAAKVERLRIAKLVTAAPEMLQALLELREELSDRSDVVDGRDGEPRPNWAMQALQTVDAAIAKATGGES